jgi:phage shock protein PspC (stress-responsive transcriptional regulator)
MKLCRSREDLDIAGVCGGLAKYLGWSSLRVRIAWVLATWIIDEIRPISG